MELPFYYKIIHFPLHPNTPSQGQKLINLFNCSEDDLRIKNDHMALLMKEENLKFKPRTHTYNTRLAQEIGFWAEEINNNFNIHDIFYEYYFLKNKNLNDKNVLLEVIKSSGLDVLEGEKVISKRLYKDKISQQWKKSYEVGVTGVPTYQINDKILVGAQPYEILENFIKTNINYV